MNRKVADSDGTGWSLRLLRWVGPMSLSGQVTPFGNRSVNGGNGSGVPSRRSDGCTTLQVPATLESVGRHLLLGRRSRHGRLDVIGTDGAAGGKERSGMGPQSFHCADRATVGGCARTAVPLVNESDGSRITSSLGVRPETTSTLLP